jgi:hypothetical protein
MQMWMLFKSVGSARSTRQWLANADLYPAAPAQMAALKTFYREGGKIVLFLPGNASTNHSQFRTAEENSFHATYAA